MSKKNLLNEQTIRRFGGIAGIQPATTSNFLQEEEFEVEEFEEEVPEGDPLAADEDAVEDAEIDLEAAEDDLESDEEAGAEQLVMDIVTDVQSLAKMAGVTVEIDDDEGALEDEAPMDDLEGLGSEVEDVEVEEEEEISLEEMINSILQEDDDDEETLEEETHDTKEKRNADADRKEAGKLRKDADEDDEDLRKEGHIQVVDDEYLMKEVSRRVKHRLAKLVKEQRRPQRVRKRKK